MEQGSHAQLVQAGGLYQRLYEEQTSPVTYPGALRGRVELGRLRSIPLFASLGSEELAKLAERLMLERYAADEHIVRQGEPGDKLYIISRGEVEVVAADGHSQRRVTTLNEGDYFGELALLTDQPRSATVRSILPTQLYGLAREDFLDLLEREPRIRQGVLEIVSVRRDALMRAGLAARLVS